MIVLGVDLIVVTAYMLLFAVLVGPFGLSFGHGNLSFALIALAAWLAVALLGSSLLWRLKKERPTLASVPALRRVGGRKGCPHGIR